MKGKISELTTFTDNAFLLLCHNKEILSDSRMSYAPVPIENNLAYTGTNGLRNPVIGVYIELWLTCEAAVIVNDKGDRGLLYHFSGSPLSGSNSCQYIFPDGKIITKHNSDFCKAWKCFRELNNKYESFKRKDNVFSIKELVSRFTI